MFKESINCVLAVTLLLGACGTSDDDSIVSDAGDGIESAAWDSQHGWLPHPPHLVDYYEFIKAHVFRIVCFENDAMLGDACILSVAFARRHYGSFDDDSVTSYQLIVQDDYVRVRDILRQG